MLLILVIFEQKIKYVKTCGYVDNFSLLWLKMKNMALVLSSLM